MSVNSDSGRVSLGEFYGRIHSDLVPVNAQVSYFSPGALSEEDLRDYLEDPLASLPPVFTGALPPVAILLVPYLERVNGKEKPGGGEWVSFTAPPEGRAIRSVQWKERNRTVIALAVEEMEVADYHYELYHQLALRWVDQADAEFVGGYNALVREELANRMHGEVDEQSWQRKQALLRRQSGAGRDTKAFRLYARDSLVDTLTLYLHGICCDIDVETGPRQLPSRYLRKRLKLLHQMLPPPAGYAVFPEDLDPEHPKR
jgi:hypothetical protein